MKKLYFLASVLLATTLSAQTTVDFEGLTLSGVSTFYNGSDGAGQFTSGNVSFENRYDPAYGSWSGFSYSNMTDSTTAGFGNQYSAYPASGANSSSKYGVFTMGADASFAPLSDTLWLPQSQANDLVSVAITNTTYAYLSMKDGDAFAKKFGAGDYFFVTFYAFDSNNNAIDSINIYLADFTSPNTANHYILDTWKTIDLSALKGVSYLTFSFSSTDVGTYGINTPKYFAIDNLVYEKASTSGISAQELLSFQIYPNPASSSVQLQGSGLFRIYSSMGRVVKEVKVSTTKEVNISDLTPGIYFVQNRNYPTSTQKLVVQ